MTQDKNEPGKKTKNNNNKGISLIVIALGSIVVLFIGLLFIVPNPSYKIGFENIDEVRIDTERKEELVPLENKDFRAPSWAKYHKKNNPGFFSRKFSNLLSLSGLKKRPVWSPSYFKFLLEKLLDQNVKKDLEKHHVVRIVPSEKTRFIVWGDLAGAYHSLYRGVEKLVSLKMLDENLKLTSPDDYIIFMGDAVNRSPFIMEELSLIFYS